MPKTVEVPAYDKWITFKKTIYQAIVVGLVAIATYLVQNGFPALISGYPEYSAIVIAASAIVTGILNWWNHRNDTKIVPV